MYARTSQTNHLGQHPIYVRVTINGQRREFTSKIFVHPKNWIQKGYRVKGNNEEANIINSYLDNLRLKIRQKYLNLATQNKEITLKLFLDAYQGTKDRIRTIVPIFQDHNKKIKALINREYALGTYQRYETTLAHLQKFLRWKFNIEDIDINKIDIALINDFDFYLRTEHKCANNSTVKYLKNFGKIIRLCLLNGWIEKDPFLNYSSKIIGVERVYLNQSELDAIINKNINIQRLDIVRDIFVFACYTGLAYIDVKQLTFNNIIKGIDGGDWIHTHRQKTQSASKIPLLDIPRQIIERYNDHPIADNNESLLPVMTNQCTNAYLKELADICGINKILTFHTARHTFATTVTLSNGVPIESVSKMLGHKSIKITQHYAKITDRKVANDMHLLKNRINSINKNDNKINY